VDIPKHTPTKVIINRRAKCGKIKTPKGEGTREENDKKKVLCGVVGDAGVDCSQSWAGLCSS
jgi:hypothetical protein